MHFIIDFASAIKSVEFRQLWNVHRVKSNRFHCNYYSEYWIALSSIILFSVFSRTQSARRTSFITESPIIKQIYYCQKQTLAKSIECHRWDFNPWPPVFATSALTIRPEMWIVINFFNFHKVWTSMYCICSALEYSTVLILYNRWVVGELIFPFDLNKHQFNKLRNIQDVIITESNFKSFELSHLW